MRTSRYVQHAPEESSPDARERRGYWRSLGYGVFNMDPAAILDRTRKTLMADMDERRREARRHGRRRNSVSLPSLPQGAQPYLTTDSASLACAVLASVIDALDYNRRRCSLRVAH